MYWYCFKVDGSADLARGEHLPAVNGKAVTDVESSIDRVARCYCNCFTAAWDDIEVATKEATSEWAGHNKEITRLGCISTPALLWRNAANGCHTNDNGPIPCVCVASCQYHVECVYFLLNSLEKFFSESFATESWKCD